MPPAPERLTAAQRVEKEIFPPPLIWKGDTQKTNDSMRMFHMEFFYLMIENNWISKKG
jgi:hypothetical protein